MDAAALSAHEERRDGPFYLTALTYAQYLWQRGQIARALLKLNRALGADLQGDEPELRAWPLPYAALAWMLRHAPTEVFIGNPRLHFQHLADRMNEPRREQRRWRAWACWQISLLVRPEFPADLHHPVLEPSDVTIKQALEIHGLPGETDLWAAVLAKI